MGNARACCLYLTEGLGSNGEWYNNRRGGNRVVTIADPSRHLLTCSVLVGTVPTR